MLRQMTAACDRHAFVVNLQFTSLDIVKILIPSFATAVQCCRYDVLWMQWALLYLVDGKAHVSCGM